MQQASLGIPWAVFFPFKSIIVFRLEEEAGIALDNFVERPGISGRVWSKVEGAMDQWRLLRESTLIP